MKIASYLKQSFIDWEGRLTAVIFTQGCNFRCGYCHNPSLVIPSLFGQTIDINEVYRFLKQRVGWLDGVVITGGEPTIQKGLKAFCMEVKQMGYDIKLDTNGTNPHLINELIKEKWVDYVAMDIKHIPEYEMYQNVCGKLSAQTFVDIMESVNILISNGINYEFRTTIIPGIHKNGDIEMLKNIFQEYHYKLQHFREGDELVEKAMMPDNSTL